MSKIRRVINRMRAGESLGLDETAQKGRQRSMNADGSYNMERRTGRLMGNFYLYHWLLTSTWTQFWFVVFGFYALMNLIFATIYYFIGFEQLYGIPADNAASEFLHCLFFSAQSFTTVGYGGMYPVGRAANLVASVEALAGLMTFALATGTLYGRFSKPVSRIKYSGNIIIAPYKDITGLQFMIANQMSSTLMEMEARVSISWNEEDEQGKPLRKFGQVKLELDKIAMFPLSWTINHPIDEESILYGRSMEEIKKMEFEVFVLIKGFDDVFSQTIYSRQSYMTDQFVFGAKFRKPFGLNSEGKVVMDLSKVGEFDRVELPVMQLSD